MPKFVPRQRKHKVVARQKAAAHNDAPAEANVEQILPAEQREREERRRAMKDELVRDTQSKMSSKKKKRLDKYVDTKLKKEETQAFFRARESWVVATIPSAKL